MLLGYRIVANDVSGIHAYVRNPETPDYASFNQIGVRAASSVRVAEGRRKAVQGFTTWKHVNDCGG